MKFALAQKLYASTLIVCIGLVAHPPAFAAGAKSGIEAANAEFSALAAKGDGAGLAALYTTDGQVMPAGSDPVRGTEAIQKFWQGALDSGISVVELKTLEVFGGGSTATEVGRYELRDKAGKTLDTSAWRTEIGWPVFQTRQGA